MVQSENLEEFMLETANDDNEEIATISDIIDKSNINEGDKKRIIACIREEKFKGPLPHPYILKQYEEIQAGFANEILGMAMREQAHRHELNKMLVQSEVDLNSGQLSLISASIILKKRLQIFGFVITTILVIAGIVCIFLDKNVGGIATFILAVGSFCWTMFYGKKESADDKELNEDNEA